MTPYNTPVKDSQQLPRKSKSVFGFHSDESKALICADFAQLELRTIVSCPAMEESFRKGEDLHGSTAAMLFGEDWTPEQRQLSKTYNLAEELCKLVHL